MILACNYLFFNYLSANVNLFSYDLNEENQKEVVLEQGTVINFELINTISSKEAVDGQSIQFKVLNDVIVDREVVIRAGTIARGEVLYSWPGRSYGAEGRIRIHVRNVNTVDNRVVFISSENITRRGRNKSGACFAFGLIPVLGNIISFAIKGESPEIPSGTVCEGYVMVDTRVVI